MLDLSNNNAADQNFEVAYHKGGQRRVYLKCVEGTRFVDKTYVGLRARAEKAGLHVGAYDFLHPLAATPAEAAALFLGHIGPVRHGHELRPCLDCESGDPSPKAGAWIVKVAAIVQHTVGCTPLIYGSGWWLEECRFTRAPGPLWLAAYGKDDGREYPVGRLPGPWTRLAAHQFTSNGEVIGIHGRCDVSHVFVPSSVEAPKGVNYR